MRGFGGDAEVEFAPRPPARPLVVHAAGRLRNFHGKTSARREKRTSGARFSGKTRAATRRHAASLLANQHGAT